MYYDEHLTEQEIGRTLGVSRFRVLRGLKRAGELGLVNVTIDVSGLPVAVDLERALVHAYGLSSVTVVRPFDKRDPGRAVAIAAAAYFDSVISDGTVVGVGISSTVAQIPQHLRRRAARAGNIVVGLSGGAPTSSADVMANPTDVSAQIAVALRARVVSLLVPFALESAVACRAVAADPVWRSHCGWQRAPMSRS